MRECFFGSHSVPATHENVLGVLSLIIYSLLLVISVKYIAIVMRADNEGEGGILALTALLPERTDSRGRWSPLVLMGIFGAALLYGDGMITPAITVLGAVEGLKVATPLFESYVVPVAVVILIAVFAIQRHGTHRVGRFFGPIMVAWFVVIAILGIVWLAREPIVLTAIDPRHAVSFFREHGWHGFAVLGAVFLVVTGGEALYADMGHFGKRPIRVAWFALVLPALLLNYFGQGALLLTNPAAAEQPFFLLAPAWALLPLVGLATAAAIIASQALISGAFSLDAAGDSTWLLPASRHRAHLALRDGAGLRAPGELGADAQHHRDCHWLRIVDRVSGRLRDCGHADDGDYRGAAPGGGDRALEMVAGSRLRCHRNLSDDRFGLLWRERFEDHARRVAATRHRRRPVHADDDLEDRTQSRGGAFDRARRADRRLSAVESSRRGPRAFRARPCS